MKAYDSAQKFRLGFLGSFQLPLLGERARCLELLQGRGAERRVTDSSGRRAGFPQLLSILGTVLRDLDSVTNQSKCRPLSPMSRGRCVRNFKVKFIQPQLNPVLQMPPESSTGESSLHFFSHQARLGGSAVPRGGAQAPGRAVSAVLGFLSNGKRIYVL